MNTLENQTNRIDFNSAVDFIIIFPSCTFEYINEAFRMESDQRVIIRFLHNEGADAHDIRQKLQAQFAQDACALRTVWFWIDEVLCDRQDLHDENCIGRSSLDDFDAKILDILDKSPFESARSISDTICVGLAIVLRWLHDSIGFRSFHLHRMPHVLTIRLREKQMEYKQAMLPFLHAAERDDWHHLVTGNELRFFLDASPHCMWTLSRDDVTTKLRHDIQSTNSCSRSYGIRTASMLSTSS
jgi:hypothetical protein